jgi:hypothetical protein
MIKKKLIKNVAILAITYCLINSHSYSQVSNPRVTKSYPTIVNGIQMAQIFDYNITESDLKMNPPAFIWGARSPWKGMFTSYYLMLDRDPDISHTVDWYDKNRPDFPVYKCDMKTAVKLFSYDFGSYTTIDIDNEEAREYLFKNYILPALSKGFTTIAFDNVGATNLSEKCMVKSKDKWIRKYSGNISDINNVDIIKNYFNWIKQRINNKNIRIAINLTYDERDVAGYFDIASTADILVDETGFSRSCKPLINNLLNRLINLEKIARDKTLVIIDQICDNYYEINSSTSESSISKFFLVKGNNTYLAITPGEKYGERFSFNFDYIKIGNPISNIKNIDNKLLIRNYENGLIIVNTTMEMVTYYFKDNIQYKKLNNEVISKNIKIAPGNGLILVNY